MARAYRWTHNEIDGMELAFLLDLMIVAAKRGQRKDLAKLEQML
jgi:hypothetical protein